MPYVLLYIGAVNFLFHRRLIIEWKQLDLNQMMIIMLRSEDEFCSFALQIVIFISYQVG